MESNQRIRKAYLLECTCCLCTDPNPCDHEDKPLSGRNVHETWSSRKAIINIQPTHIWRMDTPEGKSSKELAQSTSQELLEVLHRSRHSRKSSSRTSQPPLPLTMHSQSGPYSHCEATSGSSSSKLESGMTGSLEDSGKSGGGE
jgi:hypothetical protein